MGRSPSRTRHLIFLAHLWICAPFLFVWMYEPSVRAGIPEERLAGLFLLVGAICVYLVARSLVALRGPDWPAWEYVCPPTDAALVSLLIALGDRDPMSAISLLYFIPLAEAAGTLRATWAAAVGAWVVVGAALATEGFNHPEPFSVAFRYVFLMVFASLIASLARAAAATREQIGVARDRNRIAMEMHDGLQGHLIGIASQLELLRHTARRDPDRALELANESRGLARQAADELRYLVQRMRAPTIVAGFLPALRQYVSNLCDRERLELSFEAQEGFPALDPDTEHVLFRIAQEATHNTLKHARPTSLRLALTHEDDAVTLTISDDGTGFDPEVTGVGTGIDGMRTRAQSLGGTFTVVSAQGRGTRVVVRLPDRRVLGS